MPPPLLSSLTASPVLTSTTPPDPSGASVKSIQLQARYVFPEVRGHAFQSPPRREGEVTVSLLHILQRTHALGDLWGQAIVGLDLAQAVEDERPRARNAVQQFAVSTDPAWQR
ncbi:hypothetical protein C0992_007412 [Termitomyces sp. T32_za158]|nr:hypothetical protein C0992_007412 [Termitomyces sp. T32_za158]